MSSWSRKRKSLTIAIVMAAVIIIIGVPLYLHFHVTPTCSDGIQNGDEQGIDCGGSCVRLCQSAFLAPQVAWTRFEQVAPRLYNVAAYIINPNAEGIALNVPYHMALYDDRGILILDYTGTITLPPHRNTMAFRGAVNIGERTLAKTLFEFTATPFWYKYSDTLANLAITDKSYTEDDSGSSLLVTLENKSVTPFQRLGVYAVLYDASGNALGFSHTVVDGIAGKSSVQAPFTWPINRKGKVVSIEVLPVSE